MIRAIARSALLAAAAAALGVAVPAHTAAFGAHIDPPLRAHNAAGTHESACSEGRRKTSAARDPIGRALTVWTRRPSQLLHGKAARPRRLIVRPDGLPRMLHPAFEHGSTVCFSVFRTTIPRE